MDSELQKLKVDTSIFLVPSRMSDLEMLEVAVRYVFNNRDKLTPSQKSMYAISLTNLTDSDLYTLYSDLKNRMREVRKEINKRILLSTEVPVTRVPVAVVPQEVIDSSGVSVPLAALPESPLMSPQRQCDSDRCLYTCGEACGMTGITGVTGITGLSVMYPEVTPNSQPVQESVELAYESLPVSTLAEEEQNWVECVECKTWRKVDSCDNLPEQWVCKNIKMPCRPPKEAHAFWPSYLTKSLAKQLGQPWLSHMDALTFLARRKSIQLEELYKMSPRTYNSLES